MICIKCKVEKTYNAFALLGGGMCRACVVGRPNNAAKLAAQRARRAAANPARPVVEYVPPTNKVCSKCAVDKPLEAFNSAPQNRDGHTGRCKACRNEHENPPNRVRAPRMPKPLRKVSLREYVGTEGRMARTRHQTDEDRVLIAARHDIEDRARAKADADWYGV